MKEKILMDDKEKLRFFFHIIIPAACCIIIGYIVYGRIIFMPHITTFQIIITGLMGSVFLASLKITTLKNSTGILLIMFVLDSFFITKSIQGGYVLRDAAYYAALFLSIYYFYSKFYLRKSSSLYPLYLALTFVFMYSICLFAFFAVKNFDYGVPLSSGISILLMQILINSLIGLGIGAGTFFADKYLPLQKIIPEETIEKADIK